MADNHNLILVDGEMDEIIRVVNEIQSEIKTELPSINTDTKRLDAISKPLYETNSSIGTEEWFKKQAIESSIKG